MTPVVGFALFLPATAQESTIKVDVDIVNVLCSVRTKSGGLVSSLKKEDFTLFENGQKQDIKYFTRETDLPLTIGLLVDVSVSQERLIDVERQAAYQFFSSVLRDKDLAFLISFGHEAELLQDYTNSRKLLQKALNELRSNGQVGGLHPGPVPTASQPRGTILFDSVYLAASEQLKGQVGRKALVVITDGVDQGSRYKIEQAIKATQLSDAIIYGIYYVDSAFYNGGYGWGVNIGGGGGEHDLRRMAEETGGRMIKVDRKHTLQDSFREIQEEMRSQYALGYSPANGSKDGSFRKIDIKLSDKDLRAQARKGYYAGGSTE
ncbi:MAG: VWA domain-containing protein [Acidobacteria bacterium]|nr:VWA domain-containing protein [Acidobacteriota bacterium]